MNDKKNLSLFLAILVMCFVRCSDTPEIEGEPQIVMATEEEEKSDQRDLYKYPVSMGFDDIEDMWYVYRSASYCEQPDMDYYYIVSPQRDYADFMDKYLVVSGKYRPYKKVIYPTGIKHAFYTLELDEIEEMQPE